MNKFKFCSFVSKRFFSGTLNRDVLLRRAILFQEEKNRQVKYLAI